MHDANYGHSFPKVTFSIKKNKNSDAKTQRKFEKHL